MNHLRWVGEEQISGDIRFVRICLVYFVSGPALLSMKKDGQAVLFGTTTNNVQEIKLDTLQEEYKLSGMETNILHCGVAFCINHHPVK